MSMTPFDLAWAMLRKAVLPELQPYRGEDIKSLRWIPDYRENTYAMPQEIRGTSRGSTYGWEQQVARAQDSGVRRVLPGVLEGLRPRGTWVSPADVQALARPDLTSEAANRHTLLGITESPHWYRDEDEGAQFYDEGFQFGGFSPESFVKLPLPNFEDHGRKVRTPFEMANFVENMKTEPDDVMHETMADYFRDLGLPPKVRNEPWRQDVGEPITLDRVLEEFPYSLAGLVENPSERIDRTRVPGLQPRRVA